MSDVCSSDLDEGPSAQYPRESGDPEPHALRSGLWAPAFAGARMTGDISTIPVPEQDRLDEAALTAWMETNVAGFRGPLTYAKFAGGQSNPTYRLDSPSGRYVLRRKPFGPLLPSAHAVEDRKSTRLNSSH